MADKEKKTETLKNRLIKLHGKIQDRVEDFQDQMQTKIEAKISRLVSHLSDDRSSNGDRDNSSEKDFKDTADELSSTDSTGPPKDRISIPSFVIDEPNFDADPKRICKDFLAIEKNGVLYRRCLSTSNLAVIDDDRSYYGSSDSCLSGLSSSDERYVIILIYHVTKVLCRIGTSYRGLRGLHSKGSRPT